MTEYSSEPSCTACGMRLSPSPPEGFRATKFCPYCGNPLEGGSTASWAHESTVSIPRGKAPQPEDVQFTIGSYQILRSLGKGGMGEVYLAYDPTCGRRLALKRIREDLIESKPLQSRFLKEARLTSQLTHPAIIPIYSIHMSDKLIYYTMPYVEGETLKQILRTTIQQEKRNQKQHPIGGSIPTLIRIFMNLCQAVAYAHAEGVLHRDLKPENVMVGRYGEVLILDWGLAKLFDTPDEQAPESIGRLKPGMTRFGKIVGTATYIAPEQALGKPASVQTEVYALGVILYQLLTLHVPFGRKTMRDLRRTLGQGVFIDPAEVAPYREVPPMLSQIVSKCLAFHTEERYQTVRDLITDLEMFLEGRSEWLQTTTLDIHNKSDWEFQEHVVIAQHMEITRHAADIDWVNLMISRSSFSGNCMLEAKVYLNENGAGLGFLLSVPEVAERVHLSDGYCLWIGSEASRGSKLLLSTVEVMSAPETFLRPGVWTDIRIEKIGNNVHFSLNNQLQFSYNSPLPVSGTHVGLLSRDFNFKVKELKVYCGSQNLTVSCLAVPDAFLAHRNHAAALAEYRRIAYSFPGRAVSREAIFNAGITLLDQGRTCSQPEQAISYYNQALEEFSKLHNTPGAPLEYLGKALVYQTQEEYGEEVKCFELALRRYHSNPLLHMLQERVIHRLHESSGVHRLAAYHFSLLVVRYLPAMSHLPNAQKLFASLQKYWEPLPFLPKPVTQLQGHLFAIPLAFWVAQPFALAELHQTLTSEKPLDQEALNDCVFCLIELGATKLARSLLEQMVSSPDTQMLLIACQCQETAPSDCLTSIHSWSCEALNAQQTRILIHIIEQALYCNQTRVVRLLASQFWHTNMSTQGHLLLNSYLIWANLLENDFSQAGELLLAHPFEQLSDENNPLNCLYGCFLLATEGHEIAEIHFSGAMEMTYPRIWSLLGHFVSGKVTDREGWLKKAFLWEKRHFYRQLKLFYHCTGEAEKAAVCHQQERNTYISTYMDV